MRSYEQVTGDLDTEARPFANMSEFEYWADGGKGCWDCRHVEADDLGSCPVRDAAMVGQGWPKEWTRRTVTWVAKKPFVPGRDPWHEPQPGEEVVTGGTYEAVDECTEFEHRSNGGDDDPAPEEPPPAAVIPGQLDIIDAYLDQAIDELTPERVAS